MSQIIRHEIDSKHNYENATLDELNHGTDAPGPKVKRPPNPLIKSTYHEHQQASKEAVITAARATTAEDSLRKEKYLYNRKVTAHLNTVERGKTNDSESSKDDYIIEQPQKIVRKVLLQSDDTQLPNRSCSTECGSDTNIDQIKLRTNSFKCVNPIADKPLVVQNVDYHNNTDSNTDKPTTVFTFPDKMPLNLSLVPKNHQNEPDLLANKIEAPNNISDFDDDTEYEKNLHIQSSTLLQTQKVQSIQMKLIEYACNPTLISLDKDSPILKPITRMKGPLE